MAVLNWKEILGWGVDEIEDLRFVGYAYIKQGKFDVATTIFEALVLISPQVAYDLQTLGALYLQQGSNLMALHTIEQALKLEPAHEGTLINRAKALFALGYKKQAMIEAKALQLNTNSHIADQAGALISAYS
jgi:tetratricopeptide (TPR) repeat protein